MPFVPFDDGAEFVVTVTDLNTGKGLKNVINCLSTAGPWSAESLLTTAEAIRDWWAEGLASTVSTEKVLTSIVGRDLSVADSFIVELPIDEPGTRVQPSLPNNVTIAVKLTTGLAGRSRRGRLYHIGLTEDEVVSDYVVGSVAGGLLSYYTILMDDVLPSAAAAWAVFSRFEDNAVRTVGLATPITTVSWTDLRVDTQRKRLARP